MKLIVQIPCFNEAGTLPVVVSEIPRDIPGVDEVEILVIDDGSTDGTRDVAHKIGVNHLVVNKKNIGLARSFQKGIDICLLLGADIIVNTDGDNQYSGSSIEKLIRPILDSSADIVVGDRNPSANPVFSPLKRFLQQRGSQIVRKLSGLNVADAVSGFRAYSRDAAIATNVMSRFSYTVETLIQAGHSGLHVVSVPVATNPVGRPSRLFRSLPSFLFQQTLTILRSLATYRPLRVFVGIGMLFISIGLLPIIRFLFFFFSGNGSGHIQSLVIGSMFVLVGIISLVAALLGDTIATNRRLLERTLERVHRLELDRGNKNDKQLQDTLSSRPE